MTRRIRIVVLDEGGIVREGLRALLALDEDVEVLGAFADMAAVEQSPLTAQPEVVSVDLGNFERRGRETLAGIRRRWPDARVLVVGSCREERVVEAALGAGVQGYLLKTDSGTDLSTAIRTVAGGNQYVSPAVRAPARDAGDHATRPSGPGRTEADGLSEREREVLWRIGRGYRTREIAAQLSLSHKTIEKHRSNLMRKLGLRTATAVAAYAITNGYLEQ